MNTKRAVLMAVLAMVIAALAMPLVGLRARASASNSVGRVSARMQNPGETQTPPGETQTPPGETNGPPSPSSMRDPSQSGRVSADVLKALGLTKAKDPKAVSARIRNLLLSKKAGASTGDFSTQSGQPTVLNARSALSAALITSIGGRDNQIVEVALIADWDGRQGCTADREQKLDDFSFVDSDIDFTLTRAAISEHTVANGWTENVYYYGDSIGNLS